MDSKLHLSIWVVFLAGAVSGLTQQPGTKLWEFPTAHRIYSSPALGADGAIYFGSLDTKVYALNPNGSKRWEFVTGSWVISSPAIGAEETIYVGSLDNKLYALTSRGAQKWAFTAGNSIYSSPAIGTDGTIYFGSMDHKLYALTPAGAKKWEFQTQGEVSASPVLGTDGTIYVGSKDKRLYAVQPNGTKKWDFETGTGIEASAAIGVDGAVYVGSMDGKVYALDPTSGLKLWEFAVGAGIYSSPAVGPGGTIYVGGYNAKLYALNPDGTKRWEAPTDSYIIYSSTAVAADGTIYVGCYDSKLYAFKPDGTRKWVFASSNFIDYSSPAIAADGTVYIGSADGKLYAIKGTAGLAGGPWPKFRRDARNSGGGFVERKMPAGYSPGAKMTVTLQASPQAGVAFFAVEDAPPPNWPVSSLSHDGYFDSANRKVKFGPFFDGLSRTLTYTVTPPLGESGLKQFNGTSVAEGVDYLLGGIQSVDLVPLHPADNDPVDRWMTIEEVTAYSAAWKRGLAWPLPPNPIPISYLSRAILLWEQGEFYAYDTNFVAAPVWWTTPATNQLAPGQSPPVVPAATNITNGLASAELPAFYVPGSPFTVTITVRPATNVLAYAVEEQPPEGWTVSAITSPGVLDEWRGKIKWGPFFDALPRTLAYQVTPPTNAVGLGAFFGMASFDGANAQIGGQREMALSGSVSGPASFVERDLPFGYAPGARMLVMLTALPPTNVLFYAVEDMPPANWVVGQISDNGFFDPANRKVKFGPFLDGLPRTLAYEVTPPPGESGLKQFSGLAFADWEELPVEGERIVDFVLLHPADNNPVDSVMTLGEMTAYGAAWKRGSAWPSPPNPVPLSYLTRAIILWEEGETYTYDGSVTNAPLWWVSQKTNESLAIFGPVPLATGTNLPKSTASVELPKFYQPGLPIKVTIQAMPATNVLVYAVEDQPPIGWSVSEINEGGFLDAFQGKIKWGPFFDRDQRTLTYLAIPASDAAAVEQFYGIASFDGANLLFSGRRQIVPSASSSAPGFGALELLPKIGFQITLPGIPGEVYVIEASTNLAKWLPVATLTNTSGSLLFTDPAATNLSRRFYRAVWP
ncbi:MAG: PQQ-binding-like beta-propeller repeat protein [Verrucomicrobiota bacterium]